MRPFHLAFLLAALLPLPNASAAVRVGSEERLGPQVVIGPATNAQREARIASNGRTFLAVWDGLGTRAVRLNAQGEPEGPRQRYDGLFTSLVASDGVDYLIAGREGGAQRVDENGVPAAPRSAIARQVPLGFASNGSTYLLIGMPDQSKPEQLLASVLDRDGAVVRTFATNVKSLLSLRARDEAYEAVGFDQTCAATCRATFTQHTIREDGSLAEKTLLSLDGNVIASPAAAIAPDRVLLVWRNSIEAFPTFVIVDREGAVLTRPTHVTSASFIDVKAEWDGSGFVLVHRQEGVRSITRVTASGTILDAQPHRLTSSSVQDGIAIASNGSTQVWVWADAQFTSMGDIVSRAAGSTALLVSETRTPSLVSRGPNAQMAPDLARAGAYEIGVWQEEDGNLAGALNGVPIDFGPTPLRAIGGPAVAAGTSHFLVAWRELLPPPKAGRVLALRVGFDGRVLDAAPLVLAAEPQAGVTAYSGPRIAFGGGTFLVAASESPAMHMVSVTNDGAVSDRGAVVLNPYEAAIGLHPLWTGAEFVVAYLRAFTSPVGLFESRFTLELAHPGSASVTQAVTGFMNAGGAGAGFAAAAGRDRLTFLVIARNDIELVQTRFDGTVLNHGTIDGEGSDADLLWTGSAYVFADVVSASPNSVKIRGQYLSETGETLDTFELAAPNAVTEPRLALAYGGVRLAYTRFDEALEGTPRAVVHTIERTTSARRRGIRH